MNKLFLNLVMLFSGLWRSMGADTEHLRAILDIKLKIDDRKPLSFGRPNRAGKKNRFSSVISVVVSFFMGFIYMMPVLVVQDRVIGMMIFYSLFLLMLSFLLITDFSTVMFDTRDKYIIFPKPVSDRTIFLSRTIHVFIYLFRLVIPMALPAWIVLGIDAGASYALLFPVVLLLMVFLTLFLVNGIYLLILRLAGNEKFKEVISYFQIVFTLFIFISSYFIPSLMESSIFITPDPNTFAWTRFLPSFWLASCYTWVGATSVIPGTVYYSILAVAVPLLLMWVTVRWLAPSFTVAISGLDAVEPTQSTTATSNKKASDLYLRLAKLFNRSSAAQAGFMITWLQTGRSRQFKMRVYPMFGYAPIFFVYQLASHNDGSFAESWNNLSESKAYMGLLYLCVISVMQAFNYLTFSDQYKAAWVYYTTPTDKPGEVMIGAFKAIWLKYFTPFFIFIAGFILWMWGPKVWIDIVLAVLNMMVYTMLMMRLVYRNFPFSIMEQMGNSGGRVIRTLFSLLIPGLLAAAHYLAFDMLWLKCLFAVLSGILLWLAADSYANTSWAAMQKADTE